MPEVLHLETSDYELSIWVRELGDRLGQYEITQAKRGIESDAQQIWIRPAVELCQNPLVKEEALALRDDELKLVKSFSPREHLFFENLQYHIEWTFKEKGVTAASLGHRLKVVNAGFRAVKVKGKVVRLTGTLQTRNDLGWVHLPLLYEQDGEKRKSTLSFEVIPTKMDLHSDVPKMYESIDAAYPLWRFSLVERTAQEASRGQERGDFPLLWLANFQSMRDELHKGIKQIEANPHSRLRSRTVYTRAERLKGRLSHRREEAVREHLDQGLREKRYKVERKQLSFDTPENRFIKMVVTQSIRSLQRISRMLEEAQQTVAGERIGEVFLEQLKEWQEPLRRVESQSWLREVGVFTGMVKESLVLQQKTGYCAVYKVWLDLRYYLTAFDSQAEVSMKSVADIYEIWCFLKVKDLLVNSLGFELEPDKGKSRTRYNDYLEAQMIGGIGGAFNFYREDHVKASLAHEPIFKKKGYPLRSHLVSQKPDIMLRVEFPDGKELIWLFDAKYRIKTQLAPEEDDESSVDWVPDDAINQMHRYRDALIHLDKNKRKSKSRPVFGAFALYPGYFDQSQEDNPYAEAIQEVGIGAFPLLPCADSGEGDCWLRNFLVESIGTRNGYDANAIQETIYLQESARIPLYGMQQTLYRSLAMTVAVSKAGKVKGYFERFQEGTSRWYHMPVETFDEKFGHHVPDELRYLAFAVDLDATKKAKKIDRIWPIEKVTRVKRAAICTEKAGSEGESDKLSLDYLLFQLGASMKLLTPVEGVNLLQTKTSMKMVPLTELENKSDFKDLSSVYNQTIDSR